MKQGFFSSSYSNDFYNLWAIKIKCDGYQSIEKFRQQKQNKKTNFTNKVGFKLDPNFWQLKILLCNKWRFDGVTALFA